MLYPWLAGAPDSHGAFNMNARSRSFSDIAARKIASGFDQISRPRVQLVGVFWHYRLFNSIKAAVPRLKHVDTSLRGHFSLPQSLGVTSGFFRRIFRHPELIMVLDVKIARRSCPKNEILFEQPAG